MGMDGGGFAQRDASAGVPIEVCGRRGGDLHVLQQLRHLELRTRRRLRGRVGLRVVRADGRIPIDWIGERDEFDRIDSHVGISNLIGPIG